MNNEFPQILETIAQAENLSSRIARFRFMTLRFPQRAKESLNEHRRISDTLRNRKPNAAEKEVKSHILMSSEFLKEILKKDKDGSLSQGS